MTNIDALCDAISLEVLNTVMSAPFDEEIDFAGLDDSVVDDAHCWAVKRGWAVEREVEDGVFNYEPTDRGYRAVNAWRRRNGMEAL